MMDYETIIIPAIEPEFVAEYRLVESEWMVCIDGVTKTAYEYNRKTGEIKPRSYTQAIDSIFGL